MRTSDLPKRRKTPVKQKAAGRPRGPGRTKGSPGMEIDRIFQALGDPTRRGLLELLDARPVSLSQLAGPLKISLPAVLQHVQVLEASGLVRTEKVGRVRTCRMEPEGFSPARSWMDARRALWEKKLDRLGALLDGDL